MKKQTTRRHFRAGISFLTCAISVLSFPGSYALAEDSFSAAEHSDRPRVCITNDGEIDDKNSFVHLLYYANELDLTGLIQTSSFVHWSGVENGPDATWFGRVRKSNLSGKEPYAWPGIEWQDEFIDAYASIYDNLKVQDPNYPDPDYLHSIVKIGNVGYPGDMDNVTEGSEHVKELILDQANNRDDILYITAWGGMNTIGKALKDIQAEYGDTDEWENLQKAICEKVYIYTWYGQDRVLLHPEITDSEDEQYLQTYDPVIEEVIAPYYPEMTFIDMSTTNALGWPWADTAKGLNAEDPLSGGKYVDSTEVHELPEVMTGEWLRENLDKDHGQLLDWYVVCGDGTHVVDETDGFQFGTNEELWKNGGRNNIVDSLDQYDFVGEGDTPTYLPFFDMGLDSLKDNCTTGSLSGRFEKTGKTVTVDGKDITLENWYTMSKDTFVMSDWANVGGDTQAYSYDSGARWVTGIMKDFAARADWGMTDDYSKANHRPDFYISEGNALEAAAGENVTFTAVAEDPDGDNVRIDWFNYIEAGTYGKDVEFSVAEDGAVTFAVPEDASGHTFVLLARATDDGEHELTYYQKVIVTVK